VVFAFLFGEGFQKIGAGFQAGVIKVLPVSKPALGSKFRKKMVETIIYSQYFLAHGFNRRL